MYRRVRTSVAGCCDRLDFEHDQVGDTHVRIGKYAFEVRPDQLGLAREVDRFVVPLDAKPLSPPIKSSRASAATSTAWAAFEYGGKTSAALRC